MRDSNPKGAIRNPAGRSGGGANTAMVDSLLEELTALMAVLAPGQAISTCPTDDQPCPHPDPTP